ncbi:GNAT family N-acetyltransferase [Caldibacillus debilis]|uniref:Acetyltransferase, including N-acetylase of ribosomal protein n=2 Tax=Caldibacillus debilis TaxID=301148 RepID=A0A420VHC7_9BACI|nr:GNAT family N-acetyltransferase [Caldibacillus debilis]KYD19897.1 hypothetical protein B4135_0796 [Caldibacillus debilis]RKO62773.1 Acetyltransferase, including N-acetylase of ribosomal protein [Caldibacillus debilis GB1]
MGRIEGKKGSLKDGRVFAVRTALPSDGEKILAYMKEILAESPFLVTTPEELTMSVEEEKRHLQQMADDPDRLAIVAEWEGEIIGFLDFHGGKKKRLNHQGSFGMSVRSGFRGQGVGKALLGCLIGWAENHPRLEKINLEVFARNRAAIGLYESFGFTVEGKKRKEIKREDGSYEDLILMARFLDPKPGAAD